MFPSTLITLTLACICATQVIALPVPRVVLPSVRRPTLPRPRFVRRSSAPPLHVVAEEDAYSDKLDMRDPRNWSPSSDPAESSSTTTTTSVPAASHSKRSQGAVVDDEEEETIFAALVAQDAAYLAAHRAQMPVHEFDMTTGASLEPSGVHASLSAAMAIRQIEQRQAEADVKRREQATPGVPASEYGRMDRRRGQV